MEVATRSPVIPSHHETLFGLSMCMAIEKQLSSVETEHKFSLDESYKLSNTFGTSVTPHTRYMIISLPFAIKEWEDDL